MAARYVEWVEPDHDGVSPIFSRMTVEEAIAQQKAVVAQTHPEFKYEDDEDALLDFCCIHWATIQVGE